MAQIKENIVSAISFLSIATTLIVSFMPNDFPYRYRVMILLALYIIYGLEILFWKVLKAHRITIIFSLVLSSLLFVTSCLLYHFRPVVLTSKLYVLRNCEEIVMNGELITSNTIESLNSLHSLSSISFEKCIFEDDATISLNLPTSVTNVSLLNCEGITDFGWLSHLDNLESLTLKDCGLTDANFPNLQTRTLRHLHVDNNDGFSELKWLPPSDIENISFCATSVSNLDKLAQYKSLKTICADNSFVSDLSPLANLTELSNISFNNCRIETVMTDFMSLRLNSLSVSNNKLSDCSGFQNFTRLKDVDLSYNRLTDVSWLTKSKDTLKSVDLSGNPLDSGSLSFLSSFSYLVNLGISGIKFDSLDFIVNMRNLNTLDAVLCNIENISAISELFPKNIRVGLNNISDISPLVTILEKDKAAASAFASGYMPKFDFLDLSGNPLDGINLEKLSGNTIILNYFAGLSDININFNEIYIIDCPADQRVAIEDLNMKEEKKVFFISQKEAIYYSLAKTSNKSVVLNNGKLQSIGAYSIVK